MAVIHLRAAAYFLGAVACIASPTAHAQTNASVPGTYCLKGVMEVGSCLRFSADGRFEYFLAYGAYDENSEGRWRFENGQVVLDSPAYDRRPTFTFKRMQAGDDFDIIVEAQNGRPIVGVDVSVTCDGSIRRAGVTGAGGYKVECTRAPTQVSLGISMVGLASQSVDLPARAGPEKVYVLTFAPGDLGRKPFAAHRLRFSAADTLTMTYANTPVRELEGRTFNYVRER